MKGKENKVVASPPRCDEGRKQTSDTNVRANMVEMGIEMIATCNLDM